MTPREREVMQMALDDLEDLRKNHNITCAGTLSRLREALSAKEPVDKLKPVAQVQVAEDYYPHVVFLDGVDTTSLDQKFLYAAPPQQPEQEPVWCGCGDEIVADTGARCGTCVGIRDMRQWRGLSLEEFTAARRASQFRDVSESSCKKFYRAIEAKLREKNT